MATRTGGLIVRRTHRDVRRRTLAQNFLVDDGAVAALVAAIPLTRDDTVLDLGAGRGILTARLAERAGRVMAVERDPEWARRLALAAPPGVEVIEADLMTVALPAGPFSVVANPPFHRGTALLRRLLADGHGLVAAALVLQLEAARRLAGRGRFAATWAPWYELRVLQRVPARAFRPVPRVDAAILRVTARRPALLSPAAFAAHAALVDAVFGAPGQTLAARLGASVGRERARGMLRSSGLSPPAALREVPPMAWARLTRAARSP